MVHSFPHPSPHLYLRPRRKVSLLPHLSLVKSVISLVLAVEQGVCWRRRRRSQERLRLLPQSVSPLWILTLKYRFCQWTQGLLEASTQGRQSVRRLPRYANPPNVLKTLLTMFAQKPTPKPTQKSAPKSTKSTPKPTQGPAYPTPTPDLPGNPVPLPSLVISLPYGNLVLLTLGFKFQLVHPRLFCALYHGQQNHASRSNHPNTTTSHWLTTISWPPKFWTMTSTTMTPDFRTTISLPLPWSSG